MPHYDLTKFVDAQKTEISVSAEGDFDEMKKTETPSKRQIFGRYVVFNSTAEETRQLMFLLLTVLDQVAYYPLGHVTYTLII